MPSHFSVAVWDEVSLNLMSNVYVNYFACVYVGLVEPNYQALSLGREGGIS